MPPSNSEKFVGSDVKANMQTEQSNIEKSRLS